ncbi:MAG: hypothetical protein ACRD3P_11075 [Terriglobales bacterium]
MSVVSRWPLVVRHTGQCWKAELSRIFFQVSATHLPNLFFRAKKIVRRRAIFGVEEPTFNRRRRASFYVAGCAVMIGSFAALSNAQSTADSDVQKQFSNITTALQKREVASIDILHMPDGVMTRASVGPANLERWFESRVEIAKAGEWNGCDDLLRILQGTKVVPTSRAVDMRSAIIFNGRDGKRIGTLYIGRYFGKYLGQLGGADGAIGTVPVKFEGGLVAWLKGMIPSPLR